MPSVLARRTGRSLATRQSTDNTSVFSYNAYPGDFVVFLSMLQRNMMFSHIQVILFDSVCRSSQWILLCPLQHFHTGAEEHVITFISFHLILSCSSSSHDSSANKPQWTLWIMFFLQTCAGKHNTFFLTLLLQYISFIWGYFHIGLIIPLTPKVELLLFFSKTVRVDLFLCS